MKNRDPEIRPTSQVANWGGLIIAIVVCLGAGGLGAIATTPEIEGWYKTIEKPSWNPPDYVFGPVWTTLFILMAIAAWLVWKPAGFKTARTPLSLFAVQVVLNVAWSWISSACTSPVVDGGSKLGRGGIVAAVDNLPKHCQ